MIFNIGVCPFYQGADGKFYELGDNLQLIPRSFATFILANFPNVNEAVGFLNENPELKKFM